MGFYNSMKNFRHPLQAASLLLVILLSTVLAAAAPAEQRGKYIFYVGTYTEDGSKSKGIYAYRFDADTAKITSLGLAAETTNPSFVTLHPNGRFLYAVNEGWVSGFRGQA